MGQLRFGYRGCLRGLLLSLLLFASPAIAELEVAPVFKLPQLQDEGEISLKDYRGTVVLVDFWASWCGPCQQSLPAYNELRNRLQAKYGKEAFEVLAINVDLTKEEALGFLKKQSLDFPILRESSGKTQRQYELIGMPTAFLVDPQGKVEMAYQGYSPGHLDVLRKRVLKLIDPQTAKSGVGQDTKGSGQADASAG